MLAKQGLRILNTIELILKSRLTVKVSASVKRTIKSQAESSAKYLEQLSQLHIGFPEGIPHPNSNLLVHEIAEIHEFGTARVPERSFLRSALLSNRARIKPVFERSAKDRDIGILGDFLVGLVKERIESNVPPPLKPDTVKRKGHNRTLVETRLLYDSVTWWLSTNEKGTYVGFRQ